MKLSIFTLLDILMRIFGNDYGSNMGIIQHVLWITLPVFFFAAHISKSKHPSDEGSYLAAEDLMQSVSQRGFPKK